MRSFLEDVVTSGQLDMINELAHPDMVDEANQAFGGPPGRDGLVAHVIGFRKNIGQPQIEIHEVVGGDSQIMAWWSFSGIHSGPWLGIKPTNEAFTAQVFSFFSYTYCEVAQNAQNTLSLFLAVLRGWCKTWKKRKEMN